MTTQNYEPTLDLVKERMDQINGLMEKDNNYFGTKPESEKMRNVANMVNDIVNAKPDEALKEAPAPEGEQEELPEPEVNPVV